MARGLHLCFGSRFSLFVTRVEATSYDIAVAR